MAKSPLFVSLLRIVDLGLQSIKTDSNPRRVVEQWRRIEQWYDRPEIIGSYCAEAPVPEIGIGGEESQTLEHVPKRLPDPRPKALRHDDPSLTGHKSHQPATRRHDLRNKWRFGHRAGAYKTLGPIRKEESSSSWASRFPLPADSINLIGVRFPAGGGDPISNAHGINANDQNGRLDSSGTAYELRDWCVCANRSKGIVDYQYAVPENMLAHDPRCRRMWYCGWPLSVRDP
jgi:hypothetical protein